MHTHDKSQNLEVLIDALNIIHKTTEKRVIQELINVKKGDPFNEETISKWLDPKKNPEGGQDSYKVARCLVWYIAKHNLKIPSYDETKFPYECISDTSK